MSDLASFVTTPVWCDDCRAKVLAAFAWCDPVAIPPKTIAGVMRVNSSTSPVYWHYAEEASRYLSRTLCHRVWFTVLDEFGETRSYAVVPLTAEQIAAQDAAEKARAAVAAEAYAAEVQRRRSVLRTHGIEPRS